MKDPGTLNEYFLYNGTVPYIRFIITQVCYVICYTITWGTWHYIVYILYTEDSGFLNVYFGTDVNKGVYNIK